MNHTNQIPKASELEQDEKEEFCLFLDGDTHYFCGDKITDEDEDTPFPTSELTDDVICPKCLAVEKYLNRNTH